MLSDGEAAALGRICEASGSTPSEAVRQMVVDVHWEVTQMVTGS